MSMTQQAPSNGQNGAVLPNAEWKRKFRRRILAWYSKHARELPWRKTREPYHVWVSEIMLQQTQVVTVQSYFDRFIHNYPDIESLATAPEQEVLRQWEGLGYYRRARQLHQAAKQIVSEHQGRFPRDPAAARQLPGIGRYTAGAILSIAFDAREPILEANTIRLFSRLLALRGDPMRTASQKQLWAFGADILPRKNVGQFNQALMELGSGLCTPRQPRCLLCPVADLCPTRAAGLQEVIPASPRKLRYEDVHETAVVVRRRGCVLLRRCTEGERWAGLWDFPRFPVEPARQGVGREIIDNVKRLTGVLVAPDEKLTTIKHGVTRFRITLTCYSADYVSGRLRKRDSLSWMRPEQLGDLPLSVTGRKIAVKLYQFVG